MNFLPCTRHRFRGSNFKKPRPVQYVSCWFGFMHIFFISVFRKHLFNSCPWFPYTLLEKKVKPYPKPAGMFGAHFVQRCVPPLLVKFAYFFRIRGFCGQHEIVIVFAVASRVCRRASTKSFNNPRVIHWPFFCSASSELNRDNVAGQIAASTMVDAHRDYVA